MWRIATRLRFFSSAKTEIESKVVEVLKKFDTIDESKLSGEVTFADAGLDSLDSVEAIVALEDMLQVELTDEEALKITSVPQAVETFSKYKQ
mmetsp:Transcript_8871/g.13226  ORF Transcript_8871/g.13226 Transcript_8871/m.13226 type:complete len:92 (+) Transcript_8871:888-1163(+)|eukprot:CAMPEP_0202429920 /NCGR_PEP_ID=MMETSP1345-20130828/3515_1 /ASSEMBLY_ACC=CAM_ASM_000843 /TAXON_ID=342563 /ORGANISM="Fabrea Fabrea salina" /LENGTH=91 /DNA_ID=CAMNT_0049041269 /DNA_START=837 /DNA_END=1112 /DNA_ORIENTATION=+